MSNLERRPAEVEATDRQRTGTAPGPIEILEAREVPLGGPRAMTVRRTLPQRRRSLIGAWCFLDHYGPDDVEVSGGMRVPGHPHTGLATVTWLFEGEVEHRDTLGTVRVVRPGEVNLMTSGAGIAHSEYSTPQTTRVHGAQLWLALPEADRHGPRRFENHAAPRVDLPGGYARVFVGEMFGDTSPVHVSTPLVAAEVGIEPGATLTVPVDTSFEHGVLVDTGFVELGSDRADPRSVTPERLAYLPPGAATLTLTAGATGARVLLIGGTPFGERIVMWWNFIGRSHDEIVADRAAWQARVDALHDSGATNAPTTGAAETGDFGDFPDAWTRVLPAPELPTVRLRPRE